MTTIVPFVPSPQTPFQFNATLDGQVYTVIVTWNLFGQRYYININDSSGALIAALAMVGSPLDYDISLTAGYFDSTLVFRQSSQQFEINP